MKNLNFLSTSPTDGRIMSVSYRSRIGLVSVSYRSRIDPVSIPYQSRIILLSFSYRSRFQKRKQYGNYTETICNRSLEEGRKKRGRYLVEAWRKDAQDRSRCFYLELTCCRRKDGTFLRVRARWRVEYAAQWKTKVRQWASLMGNRLADLGCGSLGVKLKRV